MKKGKFSELVTAIDFAIKESHDAAAVKFLSSVRVFYDDKGYLTPKQISAAEKTMAKIAESERPIWRK